MGKPICRYTGHCDTQNGKHCESKLNCKYKEQDTEINYFFEILTFWFAMMVVTSLVSIFFWKLFVEYIITIGAA